MPERGENHVSVPVVDKSPSQWASGVLFAVLCSVGLGLAVALGRLAFDGGTTPLTVGLCRAAFSVLVMGMVCRLAGVPLRLPRGFLLQMLFAGVLFSHMAFGNVGATKYIPVSLAALLFFVYPPLVALLNGAVDRRRPGAVKMVAMLTAFAGLAVMLGVDLDRLDLRGVALGLTSGLACAINIVWVSRRARGLHPFQIVFYQSCVATVVLGALTVRFDAFAWPVLESGWWALGLVVALQSASIPLYYFSIQRIGTEPAAMLNNLQPVASIVAAIVLFQELLTTETLAGAAMVLGGILLMQWSDSRGGNRHGRDIDSRSRLP